MNTYKNYLALNEKIDPAKHILVTFSLQATGEPFDRTAGGVAAESSVGTWTDIRLEEKAIWDRLHAKVIKMDDTSGRIVVAYPLDLFEAGNLAQFLSSIAGNIFGLKEITKLRLENIEFPEIYVKAFPGPALGIDGVRRLTGVMDRPLLGSIIKPKLGLASAKHAEAAMAVWDNGLDLVKDDENSTSMASDNFYTRVDEVTRRMKEKGYLEINKAKIHAFNISAHYEEMMKRANYVRDSGANCLMIDILTAGFSATQGIRNRNFGLMIHGHRAMHAAFTRSREYGISMLVIAKLARLAGVDSLHTGTVVGKMEGGEEEVIAINNFLRSEWYGLKTVLPTASGGLHPGMIPDLYRILGKDMLLNFGGGIHGHPDGSAAGARAIAQSLTAAMSGIPLTEAKSSPELQKALEKWGS
ncbi:MAG TPA: ribulose-bisphosphate carboxylase large subunit [Patescibacteria group bacterium]|nr:RuBisCO long chain, Form III-c [uncultured bacterium]HLD24310.1 ribulose-bisphosphate carboxylase large subunit [Patescibacteria group bacterium]